jgi:hypothetical protein
MIFKLKKISKIDADLKRCLKSAIILKEKYPNAQKEAGC